MSQSEKQSFWVKTKKNINKFAKNSKKKIEKTSKKIKDEVIFKKVYYEGVEPPKSFAFNKKFIGLYIIFLFCSFIYLWGIENPNNIIITYLFLGNPFVFGNTILCFFLSLSFLLSIDKLRLFIFEEYTYIKQPLFYAGLIFGLYILFTFMSTNVNFISFFLFLSFLWILLLSSRFYIYSRKFSTQIETRLIKKYSASRFLGALITPFFLISVLVIISLFYRTFLVFLSLDFLAIGSPLEAEGVYQIEMNVIMPLLYFSLVLTFVFIILEFASTRRRAETKRSGIFDNFTFSLMAFFIFFFQIFQITIFLILRPETISALRSTLGGTSTAITFLFVFEFALSMIFLYRIINKLGKTYGWRILFFKRDGLILFFLGCVFAQTLTRFTLSNEIPNQEITIFGTVLLADKYIISILMIIFLGVTILVYYLKPNQVSMFIRMQQETIDKDEENEQIVYKLLRNEYIRRGEPYPIEILDRELIRATKLPKGSVNSLIKDIAKKDVDIILTRKTDDFGRKEYWIDFISITETFEKKGVAEKKAKQFLRGKLIETTKDTKKKQRSKEEKKLKKTSKKLISTFSAKRENDEVKKSSKKKSKKN
ncbi:MAG: hypothetical protein GF317_14335 [Candidatus Lokiarchaeota archaeon]|nr:hypothetical protein [Candidatus Lokiarchaeota archaeon]MBD3200784.1 hypothetical protein [Candidatus Lokiarchaeota archaeon]